MQTIGVLCQETVVDADPPWFAASAACNTEYFDSGIRIDKADFSVPVELQ
jgi:hypothetical protein